MTCAIQTTVSTSQTASPGQSYFARTASPTPQAGSFAALCAAAGSNQSMASNTQQKLPGNSPVTLVNTKTVAKKISVAASDSTSSSLVVGASLPAAPQSLQLPNQIQAFATLLTQPEVVPPEPIASLPSNLTDNALANSPESIAAGIPGLSKISAQLGINTSANHVPLVPAISISSLGTQASLPQLFAIASVADQPVSQTTNSAALPPPSLSTNEPPQGIAPSSVPVRSLDRPPTTASLLPLVGLNEITAEPSANFADTDRNSVRLSPPPTQGDSNAAKALTVKATDPQLAQDLAAVVTVSTTLPQQNGPETPFTAPNRKQNMDTRLAPQVAPTLPVIDKPTTDQGGILQATMQMIASAFSNIKDSSENPQVSASVSSAASSASLLGTGAQPTSVAAMAGASNTSGGTNTASDRQPSNSLVASVATSRSTEQPAPPVALSSSGTDLSPQKNSEMAGQIALIPPTVQQPGSAVAAASFAIQVSVGATANSGLPHKSDAVLLPPSADARPVLRPPIEPPVALPPGPVQMAQMVSRAGQSEMRIGLNTSAFGSVEVHTVVHANEVGISIGSEKGDLRSLLSNELPGIANTFQQQNLRLNHVNFQQGSTLSNSPGGNSQQQRSFAPSAVPVVNLHIDARSSGGSDLIEGPAEGSNTGLSVLA